MKTSSLFSNETKQAGGLIILFLFHTAVCAATNRLKLEQVHSCQHNAIKKTLNCCERKCSHLQYNDKHVFLVFESCTSVSVILQPI